MSMFSPRSIHRVIVVFSIFVFGCASHSFAGQISGELMTSHRIGIDYVVGPDYEISEGMSEANPFLDGRLTVYCKKPDGSIEAYPGFYAADGNAAETSATAGNIWRVYISPWPNDEGFWTCYGIFRAGPEVAIDLDPGAGVGVPLPDPLNTFTVAPSDKVAPDFRAKGLLKYVGKHYLQFSGTGEYFIKGGADSPENFLAYYQFDNTSDHGGSRNDLDGRDGLHHYDPHLNDWVSGDPTWQGNKGKRIIGALNYLASKGMNSVYFLTMNVNGDGDEVSPWTTHNGDRTRYDVSKLAQWEIVFDHMDKLGLQLHVVTQETENDQLLDGGALGTERKLYYRELIARFGHHPAVVWNLGEENTNSASQNTAFADYIRSIDPDSHPIVVHNRVGRNYQERLWGPFLGDENYEGTSMQVNMGSIVDDIIYWRDLSAENGRPWMLNWDEIGPANTGVKPDADDYYHDDIRKTFWGTLMVQGAGAEWYFGYSYPHNDLDCEDWRSRDHMWELTRYAIDFFQDNLPFHEMVDCSADVSGGSGSYCLKKQGEVHAVYLENGGTYSLDLPNGKYALMWYDPNTGDYISGGEVHSDGGSVNLTTPNVSRSDIAGFLKRVKVKKEPANSFNKELSF